MRITVTGLMLTAVPIAAIMCGQMANRTLAHQALAEQRSGHLVTAVLSENAPASAVDPYGVDPEVWALARWTAPDGAARSGLILAPAGTHAGSKVDVWVNASGATVDPPRTRRGVAIEATALGVAGGLVLDLLLMGLQSMVRRTLDRRRLEAWGSEWQATGPRWSGHRR